MEESMPLSRVNKKCQTAILKPIRTLLWYLRRPRFYPQLLNEILTKLHAACSNTSHTRKEASAWCQEHAISTNKALRQITGISPLESVQQQFAETFVEAHKQASQCPVQMGGPGNLDILYYLAEYAAATNVIETGVAYGWSSMALLLSLQKRPGSHLYSTDMPYPGRQNEEYVGCVVPQELRKHWTLIRFPDRQAIPQALNDINGPLDLCHYDSDKSLRGRMWAYPYLWKALRAGGIFISDDIGDNTTFRDFAASLGEEPIVVKTESNFVGILIKK